MQFVTLKPICTAFALASVSVVTAWGQHHHEPPAKTRPAELIEGIGDLHHPVSTKNTEAQRFFDQGLTMIYGFNHGESVRSFRRAAELDPTLAMAYWGVAIALGPNINAPMEPEAHKEAWAALQKAKKLAAHASRREADYIHALSARYDSDPKADLAPLQKKYADAMRELAQKYPDDLDAQTLFAESLMNLYPWKLWTANGKPAPVTLEAVDRLESVLERQPSHMGANHYLIHAVEASPAPQRALSAAKRLSSLAPAIGHLVHMPAHIFMRTGDYEAAAKANIDAAEADSVYLARGGVDGPYRAYYAHNLHFLSAAYSMQGRYADSLRAAEETRRVLEPIGLDVPGFEPFLTAALLVPVRFRDWDKVLAADEPSKNLKTTHNLWHFARGMAFAARADIKGAVTEREQFLEAVRSLPKDRKYGNNTETEVMQLPLFILNAKIAMARNDMPQALGHLREAVAAEDRLSYNEPPDWYYPPSREALGSLLLQAKRFEEAERVFRADLKLNQRNGRSLFGLAESLRSQNKTDEANLVEPLHRAAWAQSDRPLIMSDLF